MNSVLSIDDLSEDLEQILQWAITMKSDDEIAADFSDDEHEYRLNLRET